MAKTIVVTDTVLLHEVGIVHLLAVSPQDGFHVLLWIFCNLLKLVKGPV
ncbi:MAG: hypothetical protein K6A93_10600 [Bacteroidaceae bacterium]|nr:hypothetical protein [Bacteroidaceae bacterium]